MPIRHHQYGSVNIAKVCNLGELRRLLIDPWLESETIIIKPNWVSNEPGDFSDCDTLKALFEVLESRIVVVESYMLLRSMNLLDDGLLFSVGDKEVNWRWLLDGDGWSWLTENPSWEWFKNDGHWEQIKREDKAFLDRYGFSDLFEEYDVSYINVTEEVWNRRIASPADIKKAVEFHFQPVDFEELYSVVPKNLYDLRGSTLISLAKMKMYASFTFKNLFGLIPDPLRPFWHGRRNSKIARSVVDINKIYHSLFNVYGICESLYSMGIAQPDGEYEGQYSGKYDLTDALGLVVYGRDLVSLDGFLLNLTEEWIPKSVKVNTEPLSLAEEEFGAYDGDLIETAKQEVGSWLHPQPI